MIKSKTYTFYPRDSYFHVETDSDGEIYITVCDSQEREFDEQIRICVTEGKHVPEILTHVAKMLTGELELLDKKVKEQQERLGLL